MSITLAEHDGRDGRPCMGSMIGPVGQSFRKSDGTLYFTCAECRKDVAIKVHLRPGAKGLEPR